MFAKLLTLRLRLASGALPVLLAAGPAWSVPPELTHVPPTFDAIQDAARQVKAAHCVTVSCEAMVSIATVMTVDLNAAASTVGTPRPSSSERDAEADTDMKTAVLDHPDRFPAICKSAVEIASEYSVSGNIGDVFVPVSLLRLALAMDKQNSGTCLQTMLAMLPKTSAADRAIHNARILCANQARNKPANCDALVRHQ